MALETFAPEQWAQNLTAQHYQAMLAAGWPDTAVEQCANTLFNFTLLAGQLLMQEPTLVIATGDDQTQTLDLDEATAGQIMDYFAETMAAALQLALQQGLPDDVRQRVIETLAEDIFTYCKQMAGSIVTTNPAPPREELSQWLTQTAQDALRHYLGEYEKEFGQVNYAAVTPQADAQSSDTPEQSASPPTPSPEPVVESSADAESNAPADVHPVPPVQTASSPSAINLKHGAIAMLLKSLPPSAHPRVLRLFPTQTHPAIKGMIEDDDWLNHADPVALNQQLQGLKQALQQPPDHPTAQLSQFLQQVPWSAVLDVLTHERPIWLDMLTALKQGEPPDNPIPQFMQRELQAHLSRQLLSPMTAGSSTRHQGQSDHGPD